MNPVHIRSRIRWAWIITALIGLGTIGVYLAARTGALAWIEPRPILLGRAALVLLLAWGIYRRSRLAILVMLGLFLWSRIDLMVRFPIPGVRLFAAVSLVAFGYVLVQGARAIFAAHGIKRASS
ncbi:MAG: hypothetical protein ACM3ML_00315 [Micromonosporaceae bacterium]